MIRKKKSGRLKVWLAASLAGVLVLIAGWRIKVYAQEGGLAGTGAAIGMGAALGAGAGAGMPTAGQATRGVGGGAPGGMDDEAGGAGTPAAGSTQTTVRVTTTTNQPLRWGPDSGDQMVQQLTSRYPAAGARARTSPAQARYARRLARMTPRQRSRMVLSKYRKPPVGYLAWYLPEDRYKISYKVWQFVTTPNDRFYYYPWAPAMRLRSPSRVIGFHTWQDAMIAGYRPDPATRPAPAPRLAYFASLTRGPNLARYFEFVYAGQVTPSNLENHYRYVRYVAGEVGRHAHTRKLVGSTVEQVLGAFTGAGAFPTQVGAAAPSTAQIRPDDQVSPGGMSPSAAPGSTDRREEDFNKFGSRAAGLSATNRGP